MINAEAQSRRGAEKENLISELILDAAIEVHRTLGGPGLLESLYEEDSCKNDKRRGAEPQRRRERKLNF